jgi:hypothetical protein
VASPHRLLNVIATGSTRLLRPVATDRSRTRPSAVEGSAVERCGGPEGASTRLSAHELDARLGAYQKVRNPVPVAGNSGDPEH